MRRRILITLLLFIVAAGGYLLLKYKALQAEDYQPDPAKKENPLDLRPDLIAKLQQLVRDGSSGLYQLSIGELSPDIATSTVAARQVVLAVDSAGYRRLEQSRQLPDDVFRIRLEAVRITGINIDDLLKRREIAVSGVTVTAPEIEVFHKQQPYNAATRAANKKLTLYQRLTRQMDRIAIERVTLSRGSLQLYNGTKRHKQAGFRDISVRLDDILIDSTTQYDNKRFLFARKAVLEARDYSLPAKDSLYLFKVGHLSVSGADNRLVARNVSLVPLGGRAAFMRRQTTKEELFTLSFPEITLSGVAWWALVNGEGLRAADVFVNGGSVGVFLDKSLPPGPPGRQDNFPHQRLQQLPVPVSVQRLRITGLDLAYEEKNPRSGQSGTVRFQRMDIKAGPITNVPEEIRARPAARLTANGLFMSRVPFRCSFGFDLSRHRTGDFTVDVHMGVMNHTDVNPFSEALAQINIPSGQMQESKAQVSGNNHSASGKVSIRYTGLRVTPLKKSDDGTLKKKKAMGFLANALLIENNNPDGDDPLREPQVTVERTGTSNFFNLIWTTIRTALMKTIGIPETLQKKKK